MPTRERPSKLDAEAETVLRIDGQDAARAETTSPHRCSRRERNRPRLRRDGDKSVIRYCHP